MTRVLRHYQIRSDYLRHPLSEELDNQEIFLGTDAIQVVKYHGSYQQDNRELRKAGEQKVFFPAVPSTFQGTCYSRVTASYNPLQLHLFLSSLPSLPLPILP